MMNEEMCTKIVKFMTRGKVFVFFICLGFYVFH